MSLPDRNNPYNFDEFLAWRQAVDYYADDPFIQKVIRHGQRMTGIGRNLEPPFLTAAQVKFPANSLDPMYAYNDSII